VTQPLPDVTAGPCVVCGETADPGAAAICNGCGERYHLVLTQGSEGKDCGEVWLNEEFLALEFGCAICLAEHRGLEAPPPPSPDASAAPPRSRAKHTGLSARDIVRRKQR